MSEQEIDSFIDEYLAWLSASVQQNNAYEMQWATIKSKSDSTIRTIEFDGLEIPPGFLESSWFANSAWVSPHDGFDLFDGNLIIGSDPTVFNSPGIGNLKSYTGRDRIGIGPLSHPVPGTKTVIGETSGNPFDLVSIDICPVDYNNLSLRFKGYDSGGVEVASLDLVASADTPKRVFFLGFSRIHSVTVDEFDPATKVVHPDKDPGQVFGVGVGMINFRYKLKQAV